MRWFAALLNDPKTDRVARDVRANALRAYGSAADIAGDDAAARELYERSLALFEQLGTSTDEPCSSTASPSARCGVETSH